jgi:glycosyltransferase involved in cell wall biosynthesis
MNDLEKKKITFPKFSVVIPTLGGDVLFRTISLINSGSSVPDEILICIPIEFTYRVIGKFVSHNVKIIETKCKGQVAQRIEGFMQVNNEYVVQMDDDMFVYETCLERLIEGLNSFNEEVSISPAMIFDSSKKSCYAFEYSNLFLYKIIHGNNWSRPGSITRAGVNIGLNAFSFSERHSSVDWLPGGCVAHKKQNLILYNFFPFQGKAFYEDVIHSLHLTKNGVKLLIDNSAICGIDDYDVIPITLLGTAKNFNRNYPFRKHIVDLKGGSIFYLFIDGIFNYLLTINSIRHILRNSIKGFVLRNSK